MASGQLSPMCAHPSDLLCMDRAQEKQSIQGKKVSDIHEPHPTGLEKEQDETLTPQLPSKDSR